jgi:hypothetical protein
MAGRNRSETGKSTVTVSLLPISGLSVRGVTDMLIAVSLECEFMRDLAFASVTGWYALVAFALM